MHMQTIDRLAEKDTRRPWSTRLRFIVPFPFPCQSNSSLHFDPPTVKDCDVWSRILRIKARVKGVARFSLPGRTFFRRSVEVDRAVRVVPGSRQPVGA